MAQRDFQKLPWQKALERLVDGNQRFLSGLRSAEALLGHKKLKDLAKNGQSPFAIVLSCSDSRVPAELLFDCGFGELFVIRVAGNIAQPSQIASIEYAAKVLGASLCIVMGHSQCGAVQAALDAQTGKSADLGPHIGELINLISPAVKQGLAKPTLGISTLDACIRENVALTSESILKKSSILSELEQAQKFKVVEAVVNLESGRVAFQESVTPHSRNEEELRKAL